MKVTGFNHLTLKVRNLEESLPFFLDVLGMRPVHRGRKDAYLEWGDAWICLLERDVTGVTGREAGMDHVAFSIREEDFPDAVERLRKRGVAFIREPVRRGGGWSVQFSGPDGIVLELFTGNLARRMENWK
ncbi:VOC family protein [Staphylospora marina]|uniref:VOC family protein n=1 Tax=Staphylospora marina TaxID=2490858 RepID=UPI000F5B92CD|nr:VOC family protein [Staphylospora marina]